MVKSGTEVVKMPREIAMKVQQVVETSRALAEDDVAYVANLCAHEEEEHGYEPCETVDVGAGYSLKGILPGEDN
jgi:hypothetical protein